MPAQPRRLTACCDGRESETLKGATQLWSGRVADPQVHDADTDALRSLNAKIRDDTRVDACLLTVGDGVMLAQKRPLR